MGPNKTIQEHKEQYATIKDPTEPYWTIWDQTEADGTTLDHIPIHKVAQATKNRALYLSWFSRGGLKKFKNTFFQTA